MQSEPVMGQFIGLATENHTYHPTLNTTIFKNSNSFKRLLILLQSFGGLNKKRARNFHMTHETFYWPGLWSDNWFGCDPSGITGFWWENTNNFFGWSAAQIYHLEIVSMGLCNAATYLSISGLSVLVDGSIINNPILWDSDQLLTEYSWDASLQY